MWIGPRIGSRIGQDAASTPADPLASVARDASSGKYTPATAAQWAAVFSAAGLSGTASHTHSCQESSGNLADGTGAMTLVPNGTNVASLTYQNALTGWSRKAVATAGDNNCFDIAAGAGPNPASESVALYFLFEIVGALGDRSLVFVSRNNQLGVRLDAAGQIALACAGVATAFSTDHRGAVRPGLLVYRRGAGDVKLYTDRAVYTGTYSAAVLNDRQGFGRNNTQSSGTTRLAQMAWFKGTAAEQITQAAAKKLLQTLNWSIPW